MNIISIDEGAFQLVYKCVNVNGQLEESVYLNLRKSELPFFEAAVAYVNGILNNMFEGRLQLTQQNMTGCSH